MKRIVLLATLLASALVCAFAAGPNTWSSYVDDWGYYALGVDSDPVIAEIAAFTPEKAITVTRLEIEAVHGPYKYNSSPVSVCVINPSLTLKGGTTAYTLPITASTNIANNLHSFTDSGVLNLRFDAGTKLTLNANQGDANCVGPIKVNIVVQYHGSDAE